MLAVGRALMCKPALLMLDEPSLGLAPLVVRDIFATIAALRATGVTILLVEQNARAALEVADHGYVLEMGEIALEGPAAELARDPRVIETYLGAARQKAAPERQRQHRSTTAGTRRRTAVRSRPAETRPHTAALDQSRLTHLVGYAASARRDRAEEGVREALGAARPEGRRVLDPDAGRVERRVNQKQLGQALDISPPNMAVTLDRMVERGWVERVRSTQDRRAQHIHLTPAGRDARRARARRSRRRWRSRRCACCRRPSGRC